VQPFHELKLLPPEVDGAVTVTDVPLLYARVNGVEPLPSPLLSFGDTVMEIPLAGFDEATVN
jgi:hypothetical protein